MGLAAGCAFPVKRLQSNSEIWLLPSSQPPQLHTMDFAFLALAFCLLCLLFLLLRYRTVRGQPFTSSERQCSSANCASIRISRNPALIRTEYDITIVGSGYGGGVAASRFARAGKSVCVLEKGAEVLAGQFPHTFKGALRESYIRDIRPGRYGSLGRASGLYQTYKGKGQDVFTGSGLGGTSLINAGVFLRADRKILGGPEWPVEIRETIDDLSQCKKRIFVVANVISPCVAGLIVNRL